MDEPVRILCVDDEINVLRAIERIFMDDEYEIMKATSGAEGLEILKEVSPIQIVISDYRMPEMSGVDFLREVRDYWPETVRIVLSGYADAATIVAAINEGRIYKFIPKPWNTDELRVTIENALERYYLNRRNIELTMELKEKNDELNRINSCLEKTIAEKTAEVMLQNRILLQAQTILHHLPVGVITANPDGIVIQCNREAERILSCPDIECPGTPLGQLLSAELTGCLAASAEGGEESGSIAAAAGVRLKMRQVEDPNGGMTILLLDPLDRPRTAEAANA
jgi:two-component system NtrC family sensor kinase